jgi:hypothetical protein
MNALPLHVGAPDSTVIYANHRTTTQNGIAQAMFKESSRTFEGRVRNRSRFGRRRSVPSTSLTATSLNNLTTLLLTQATTWQQSRSSNTSNETALGPEHPDTAAALCNLASLFLARGASPGRARSWSEPARSMKRPSAPCISLRSLPRLV